MRIAFPLLLVVAVAFLTIAGCAPMPPEVEVNDELRAVCPTWSDEGIQLEIEKWVTAWMLGYSYAEARAEAQSQCNQYILLVGSDVVNECVICELAIIDAVYAR